MGVRRIPLNPFNNVVPSGVANVDLSNLLGFTINRIILALGGGALTAAMLTSVVLKANGKIIVDTTGARLSARNGYRGLALDAGFLTLDFTENRFLTKLGYLTGALDTTVGIKSLRLELTIAGATTPTVIGWAMVDSPQVDPSFINLRPLIARVHSQQVSIAASGFFPIPIPHMLPSEGGSVFKRICVFSNNATAFRVTRNGVIEDDMTRAANEFMQREYLRLPQTGLMVFDATLERLQEDIFDTRPASGTATAQFGVQMSAAETFTVEVEVLEPLDVY